MSNHAIQNAADILKKSRLTIAFTGAGISVESGIPPFRGPGGLWTEHDPSLFEMRFFRKHPDKSWTLLKKLLFERFTKARPNRAHIALAELEQAGKLTAVVTQNIDGLHQQAGNETVLEYHGSPSRMQCMKCRRMFPSDSIPLDTLPPRCPDCNGILKPDIVFFSEGIPDDVHRQATRLAKKADAVIVIGTTGEVQPAARIPWIAHHRGATIIEINPKESSYTYKATDIFLKGKAGQMLPQLIHAVLT
jgi:NAD-dependent deacetylase